MPKTPARLDRPVTQTDIAQVVGCSQNTVALALRESPRISSQRRREILRVARQMGYRANVAARSLRRGRTGLIGLFTGMLDFVRLRYARQMLSLLHTTEYKPILGTDDGAIKPWYRASWIETLRELQVEALVSFAWHDFDAGLPTWRSQIPIIMSGFSTRIPAGCDCINMDRRGAGQMATEHLLRRGLKRVEMITSNPQAIANNGYVDAMKQAGLRPTIHHRQKNESEEVMAQLFIQRLKAKRRVEPIGIFAISSPMAAYLCNMAREAGIRIPQDLAVVGYDYMQWADRVAIPLTTVEQPIDELVKATINAVRVRLSKPAAEHIRETLPFNLVKRASA